MAKDYNHILVDTGPPRTSLNKGKEISGFKTNCVVWKETKEQCKECFKQVFSQEAITIFSPSSEVSDRDQFLIETKHGHTS